MVTDSVVLREVSCVFQRLVAFQTYLQEFICHKMGKHFGELAFIRGIVYYKISAHEQKPFAGAITKGIPNAIPRTSASILYWLPPFVLGWLTYTSVEEAHYASTRKNPKDYADEVDPALLK